MRLAPGHDKPKQEYPKWAKEFGNKIKPLMEEVCTPGTKYLLIAVDGGGGHPVMATTMGKMQVLQQVINLAGSVINDQVEMLAHIPDKPKDDE